MFLWFYFFKHMFQNQRILLNNFHVEETNLRRYTKYNMLSQELPIFFQIFISIFQRKRLHYSHLLLSIVFIVLELSLCELLLLITMLQSPKLFNFWLLEIAHRYQQERVSHDCFVHIHQFKTLYHCVNKSTLGSRSKEIVLVVITKKKKNV